MIVELIFVTYNRLEYTMRSLPSLLSDPDEDFTLTLWDNASSDDTTEYLDSINDPRIIKKIYSKENFGLKGAANNGFSESKADLIGIAENDFLYTPGWTRILAEAHADIPQLGKVACWHLGKDSFNEKKARHKIQRFGMHQILRHPWTGGGAGLMKLKTWKECGPFESNATTSYWKKIAKRGYINGWYYPLIHFEHMDYPWSKYYAYSDEIEKGFKTSVTTSKLGIKTVEEARALHNEIVKEILEGPWDVKYYLGWYQKWRRLKYLFKKYLSFKKAS